MSKDSEVKQWLQRLESNDLSLCCEACAKLGKVGDLRAVNPLIERLSDSSPDVRTSACRALGQLGDKQAIDPLIQCLGDSEGWGAGLPVRH